MEMSFAYLRHIFCIDIQWNVSCLKINRIRKSFFIPRYADDIGK